MEWVKSVPESTSSTSCMAIATEVGISQANVYRVLINSLGKRKVCAKWIPHVRNDDQSAKLVFLAITHLQHWKYEGNAFFNRILILWVMDASLDHQLKRLNAEWCAQTSWRKKTAWNSQGALKVIHVMFFSQNWLVLDHHMPFGMMVDDHYYCAFLQDKVKS